jgi:hypothetical protein
MRLYISTHFINFRSETVFGKLIYRQRKFSFPGFYVCFEKELLRKEILSYKDECHHQINCSESGADKLTGRYRAQNRVYDISFFKSLHLN